MKSYIWNFSHTFEGRDYCERIIAPTKERAVIVFESTFPNVKKYDVLQWAFCWV